MRNGLSLLTTLLPFLLITAGLAEAPRVAKGPYEIALTQDGLEARFQGTPIICASHLAVQKPEWKGLLYLGRDYAASKTAVVTLSEGRIAVTDTAPQIEGQISQEFQVDEKGILVSVKLSISKDIPASPGECVLAVFPADQFAGGRYRPMGLLGTPEWQPIPSEMPRETGPGTKHIMSGLLGLEIVGKDAAVRIECLQGPAPSFYDMRSREYPPAEKNFWLLYSWPAGKGEMLVQARITARAVAAGETAEAGPGAGLGPSTTPAALICDGGDRSPVKCIFVDGQAHPVEKAAAQELGKYMARITGRALSLVEGGGERPSDKGVIYVGAGPAARRPGFLQPKLVEDNELETLGYDGYVLRSAGGNVIAAGKNPRGTVYAVYRLLEKLGCRFYARELETVPAIFPVEIPGPFALKDEAAFEWRAMGGTIAPMKCGLSPGEWEASVGQTPVPKMMAYPKGGFWHHTMGYLLPAEPLEKEHPDWLALIGGQRKAVGPAVQQYCLSNPDLLKAMTTAVLDWIAADPDKDYYPVHYGDVVKFCECEKCRALYAEKGSLTDAVIWFDNQIAKEVAQKHPGKFVTILAYHSTRTAPLKVKPEPNLLIIFCAIVECQGRPWTAPINLKKNVCKDLEDWARVHPLGAKGIMSFDYPTTYHYAGFPYPALYAFVENIRYYRKVGLRGVYVCGLGSWKHLEHVYSYVIPRIMWNPDANMNALIDEFCRAWYGAAGLPMQEYVEMLHRGAMDSTSGGVMDCHAGPGQKYFRELYTRDFLDRAYAFFAAAQAKADSPLVARRIQKEKWGLLFVDLFLYGQKGGDLVPVPTDAGIERKTATLEDYVKLAELLQIGRLFNRPWNMEPRRRFTLTSMVGFEPTREPWWTCPMIRELMEDPQAAHRKQAQMGQELERGFITLENEAIKATVIPRLGGRIWRLYDKKSKQDLFWRGVVPISAVQKGLSPDPYANIGGYEEYAGEKFGSAGWAEVYEVRPTPDAARRFSDAKTLTMSVVLGGGLRLTRTVSLVPNGIEIDSTLENTTAQPIKDAMLRVHPEFNFKVAESGAEFFAQGEAGPEKFAPAKGENYLSGKRLPRGKWMAKLPKRGLSIVNEFDPAQVATCLLYVGPEFFNLELFSPKKDLAPGEKLRIKHRYAVE